MKNTLKFTVQDIKDAGTLAVHKKEDPLQWDLETPPGVVPEGELLMDLNLEYLEGGEVLLSGRSSLGAKFQCSRCLEPFRRVVPAEIQAAYETQEVHEIDAWDEIRQSLFLAIPENPLCRENCKGLCPQCGKDWNSGDCTCVKTVPAPGFQKLKDIKL